MKYKDMTYAEFVKKLRVYENDCPACENDTQDFCANYCEYNSKRGDCLLGMIDHAADAIERLQTENNALRSENETYHKLVLLSVGEINELRYKLHLDEMEIDGPFSIEDLKIPSGNGLELRADGVSKLQMENDESSREEQPNDPIRPN